MFEAVTRTGSFTGAAGRLGVTPSAVSLQIRQLERACGVPLFERRRVQLTAAGRRLEEYARRIVALAADAEPALEETRGFAGGQLRLVASATSAAYHLPPLLTRLRQRYPGIRVRLETAHPDLEFVLLARDPCRHRVADPSVGPTRTHRAGGSPASGPDPARAGNDQRDGKTQTV